jgi:UDP-N-acetylglucosamine 2-epimerase
LCDEVFCFSEKDRNTLIKCDTYSPEAVKVVGNYFMEDVLAYLDRPVESIKKDFCRENSLPEDCEIITLVSQALAEDNWEDFKEQKICKFLEDVYYTSLKHGNRYLIVKLHPRENLQKYSRIFSNKETCSRIRFIKEGDMNALMRISDVVIGFFSAALMNAMILNKPVYVVKWLTNQEYPLDYAKLNMAGELKSITDLEEIMDKLQTQTEKTQDNGIDFYIGPPFSRNKFRKEVLELLSRGENMLKTSGNAV